MGRSLPLVLSVICPYGVSCVDFTVLMAKLGCCGIGGAALSWLSSYLTDHQRVVIDCNSRSDYQKVNSGDPQVSVLGPLLFLIFVMISLKASKNLMCSFSGGSTEWAKGVIAPPPNPTTN